MNTKTKIVGMVVVVAFLTGCGNPFAKKTVDLLPVRNEPAYRESEIKDQTDNMNIYVDALAKFSKQTHGKKLEQIDGGYGYDYYESDPPHMPPSYTLKQPMVAYITLAGHEYWVVESGREYKAYTGKELTTYLPVDENTSGARFHLYTDGKKGKDVTDIFGQTLCWGIDGIEGKVNDIKWVAGDLAFKYIVGDCTSSTSTVHAYIQGMPQEKVFRIDQSRYPFDYKGKAGFIAELADKEYVVVNGRIVSEGYDKIYTNSCCAMPFPAFELYDDGYLYFIGIRDHKAYAVETNIETFNSELILKTNVDKNTLKK